MASLPSLPTFHEDPGDPGGPLPAIDDAEVVALVLRPQRQELDAVVAVEPDARHPSVAPRTLLEELQAPLVPEADHLVRKIDLHISKKSMFFPFLAFKARTFFTADCINSIAEVDEADVGD